MIQIEFVADFGHISKHFHRINNIVQTWHSSRNSLAFHGPLIHNTVPYQLEFKQAKHKRKY